jgi:OmpA-OmpF porin, OOP family
MNNMSPMVSKLVISSVISVFALGGCTTIVSSAKKEPMVAAAVATPAPAPMVKDSDNDGVPDDKDACPNTRPGATVDHKGCEIIGTLENPHFEFDSAALTADARGILDKIVTVIKGVPERKFEIAGHTDSKGSDDYNSRLGESRAISVVEYMTRAGINADHLMVRSYGESKPIASNDDEAGQAMNRRVEVVEVGM